MTPSYLSLILPRILSETCGIKKGGNKKTGNTECANGLRERCKICLVFAKTDPISAEHCRHIKTYNCTSRSQCRSISSIK